VSETYTYDVYAIKIPDLKSEGGKFRYAVKRTTPPHRGKWDLVQEIHPGPHGGGWDRPDMVKFHVRSFLKSKKAKLNSIVSVTIVKLTVVVVLDHLEVVSLKSASIVDRIAQTDYRSAE
jgi:hypothetical protein